MEENTGGRMKLKAPPVHLHVVLQSFEDGQNSPVVGIPREC